MRTALMWAVEQLVGLIQLMIIIQHRTSIDGQRIAFNKASSGCNICTSYVWHSEQVHLSDLLVLQAQLNSVATLRARTTLRMRDDMHVGSFEISNGEYHSIVRRVESSSVRQHPKE